MRLYHLMFDTYRSYLSGRSDPDALTEAASVGLALRQDDIVARSFVDRLVAAARETAPEADAEGPAAYGQNELQRVLAGIELPVEPGELPFWRDDDELHLEPLSRAPEEFDPDMGCNFRYGPATILIKVEEGENIDVRYEGRRRPGSSGRFELLGPEMTLLAEGVLSAEAPLRIVAGSAGLHTLNFTAGGAWARLHIANRYAVVKASSVHQHLHPVMGSHAYFYVPQGTREFAIVLRSDPGEAYGLVLWAPHDASDPLEPEGGFHWRNAYIRSVSTSFEEHRIAVPEGADGQVWRYLLHGEDKKIFLRGIPPFLAGSPGRLLVPPDDAQKKNRPGIAIKNHGYILVRPRHK